MTRLFLLLMLSGFFCSLPGILFSKHDSGQDWQITASSLMKAGNWKEAELLLAPQVKHQQDAGQWESYSLACVLLGQVYYYQENFLAMGLLLKEGLKHSSLHLSENHPNIGFFYQLLGIYADRIGDLEESQHYAMQALSIRQQKKHKTRSDSVHLSADLNNLAAILSRKGAFREALTYYDQSEKLAAAIYPPGHLSLCKALINLGDLHQQMGNLQTASFWYQKSISAMSRPADQAHARTFSKASHGLASCYRELGQPESAISVAKDAISVRHQFGLNAHLAYRILGETLLDQGQTDAGLQALRSSLTLNTQQFGRPRGMRRAYPEHALGKGLLQAGQPDSALYYLQHALYRLASGFTDSTGISNPEPEQLISRKLAIQILRRKAQALTLRKAPGDLEAALEALVLAFDLTDYLRDSYPAAASRYFISKDIKVIAESILSVCYQRYTQTGAASFAETAFEYAERSRAVLLLESIRRNEAVLFPSVPETLITKEKQLDQAIANYESLQRKLELSGKEDSLQVQTTRDKLFQLRYERDELDALLKKEYPEYHTATLRLPPATPPRLQQALSGGSGLFEFFLGDSGLYYFVLSPGEFVFAAIPLPEDFSEDLKTFQRSLSEYAFVSKSSRESWQAYTQHGYALRNILFPQNILPDSRLPARLFLVPDGPLHFLPFEALLEAPQPPDGKLDYLTLPYLIRKHSFQYSWSASLWLKAQSVKKSSRQASCLSMSPGETGNPSPNHPANGALALLRDGTVNLPGANQEVKAISQYFEGEYYTGAAASKATFLANARKHSILHLATHGVSDPDNPMASYLRFADTEQDSSLKAWEIFGLNLDAELVVLSACETGLGQVVEGEGVLSIARSFARAGATSIVTTLWKVEDRASTKIVAGFFKEIAEGKAIDGALRDAKLAFLRTADSRTAHPLYWAGFVSIGNAAPIMQAGKTLSHWVTPLAVGIFILIILAFYRQGKIRSRGKRSSTFGK